MTNDIKEKKPTSTMSRRRLSRKNGSLAAMALLGALVFAAPASASSSISFSFSFGQGFGGAQVFSGASHTHAPVGQNYFCMSNSRIEQGLRGQGWSDVRYVTGGYTNYPQFTGVWNGWAYSMLINRCTGDASNVEQLRPAQAYPQPRVFPNPFWWQFQQPRPYGGNSDILYHRD